MILIKAILFLTVAPFGLIVVGLGWLWLGHKLLRCFLGR
ncbi:hypothetical protein OKW46_003249 [Paraburkholderia sp. WSM4179]|nr:hypothetical protein [Paraburkholderia sp. WSM4179]